MCDLTDSLREAYKFENDWHDDAPDKRSWTILLEAAECIDMLEKVAEKYKDIAEYWINRVDTRHMCEQDYNNWLALGHKAIHAAGARE